MASPPTDTVPARAAAALRALVGRNEANTLPTKGSSANVVSRTAVLVISWGRLAARRDTPRLDDSDGPL